MGRVGKLLPTLRVVLNLAICVSPIGVRYIQVKFLAISFEECTSLAYASNLQRWRYYQKLALDSNLNLNTIANCCIRLIVFPPQSYSDIIH